jgi:D-sedoheptulose 7-phosphate isomerase
MLKTTIKHSVEEAVFAAQKLKEPMALHFIEQTAHLIAETFRQGNKILIAGNGGSLSDSTHFAEELTGYFRKKRPALPAIALADAAHISCVGNDAGFDQIFSRGVDALGKPGDLFIGLTTSGNSPNILKAIQAAKQKQMRTIAFLGKSGGAAKGVADLEWIECVEAILFPETAKKADLQDTALAGRNR